jgi:hypothetical protein
MPLIIIRKRDIFGIGNMPFEYSQPMLGGY